VECCQPCTALRNCIVSGSHENAFAALDCFGSLSCWSPQQRSCLHRQQSAENIRPSTCEMQTTAERLQTFSAAATTARSAGRSEQCWGNCQLRRLNETVHCCQMPAYGRDDLAHLRQITSLLTRKAHTINSP